MKKKRIPKSFFEDFSKVKRLTSFLVVILLCLSIGAQNLSTPITIKKKQIGVEEAFSKIKSQAHVYIMYENRIIDKNLRFSLNLNKVPLRAALDEICSKAGLQYEIMDKHILIKKIADRVRVSINMNKSEGSYSRHNITGQVLDETGDPIYGAVIRIDGKQVGTISDSNGFYSIYAINGEKLKFTFIGMEETERQVTDNDNMNVTLHAKPHLLNNVEVVSTGYQNLPKDRITGSFGSISSEELAKVPSPNVIQRLEGKIPGMKITLYSGDKTFDYTNTLKTPNSSTHTVGNMEYNMNIRGVSSLQGETFPLIVVDGVITEMDLSSINPNDIENITVLKDAAAASIWGVRAANGVIVVTTKKGHENTRPKVSFSTSFTFAGRPDINYLKMMNSSEMLDYEKELVDDGILYDVPATSYDMAQFYFPEGTRLASALKNGSITQDEYNTQVSALSKIDDRSQLSKYFMQPSSSQQYNLSVNGGGNNSQYYYSASYSKEDPSVKRNSAQRLTLDLDNSWKLFNWATLSTNFKGSFFTYIDDGTTIASLYPSSGRVLMPYENIVDNNGKGISYNMFNPSWISTLSSAYKDWTCNYLNELNLRDNKQQTNNISGNINLSIPIYKGIESSTLFSIEKAFTKVNDYLDPNSYYVRDMLNYYTYPTASANSLGIVNGGILNRTNTDESNYTFRQQFNYNAVLNSIHKINALAGIELRETNLGASSFSLFGYNKETGYTDSNINFSYTPTYSYVGGYSEDSYTTFNYGGYPSQTDKRRRFISYYSNVAYTLMNRYSLSGSVRYDDYNNFGVDRKYRATPLYSFGTKWILSHEKFMEPIKWINNLAVRLTYGINGNISLDSSPYTAIYLTTNYTTYQPSAGISSTANPELRWEKNYTTNLGIDFNLFNNRLNGSFDFYDKRSRDLLYSLPMGAALVGTVNNGTIFRNAAAVNGHGVEVSLSAIAYKDEDWKATIGLQLSYNTNKVGYNPYFKESSYVDYYSYYPTGIGLLEGYSTDKLLVYRNAGLSKDGLTQVYDENGNIVPATQSSITSIKALKNAGHQTPPYFGSVNLNLKYKQFSLYALATYQFGSVFIKPTICNYVSSLYSANFDVSKDIAKRWKTSGDEAKTNVPKISSSIYSLRRYANSDINVLKGDYIRMRQISLSYQIDNALISKVHANSANISLSVNNLGLLWKANKQGYDPDYISYVSRTYNLPAARSYSVSLNVNF